MSYEELPPTLPFGVPDQGTRLAKDSRIGRLKIVEQLGTGGMGEVYRAYDETLERSVALKAIHPRLARTGGKDQFLHEARTLSQLSHPNICQIYDLIEHDSTLFLVLELVEGKTLASRSTKTGHREACRIARQIAEALDTAHQRGIVHRDLKPSNIMLTDAGNVKVLDFGIALIERKVPEQDTEPRSHPTRSIIGTPMYLSPEQADGGKATTASDVFGLGLVFRELLTGRSPHPPNLSRDELIAQAAVGAQTGGNRLPRRISHLLDMLLAKQPRDRPSASEATKRLQRLERAPSPRNIMLAGALGFLLVTSIWLLRSTDEAFRFEPVRQQQISFRAGLEVNPAFSPTDARIAYSADTEGGFEIFVHDLDLGEQAHQLTFDGLGFVEPSYSPDGRRLAVTSLRHGSIWLAPSVVGEGSAKPLTDFGAAPAWSPDGRWIAFQSHLPTAGGLHANSLPAQSPSSIWRIEVESGHIEQLTRPEQPPGGHGQPSWATKGRAIFFSSSDRSGSELFRLDLDSGEIEELPIELPSALSPLVARSGELLFFTAQGRSDTPGPEQGQMLWAFDLRARGLAEPQVVAGVGVSSFRQLTIHPAHDRIAFSAQSLSSNLWQVELDASGRAVGTPRQVTEGTGRTSRPAFSPDGERLAFDRWTRGQAPEIYLLEFGSDETVAAREQGATQASWFPDGSILSFSEAASEPHGGESKRVIQGHITDLRSGEERLWVELDHRSSWVHLDPLGSRIAYHAPGEHGRINLWVSEVASGNTRQLTFDSNRAAYPVWSTDGQWVAYSVVRGENTQLAIVDVDSGRENVLTDEPGHHWPYSWNPDSTRIAFAHFHPELGGWSIDWLDRELRTTEQLTAVSFRHEYLRYPAWSPQGDRIIFERAANSGDIWMMDIDITKVRR